MTIHSNGHPDIRVAVLRFYLPHRERWPLAGESAPPRIPKPQLGEGLRDKRTGEGLQ